MSEIKIGDKVKFLNEVGGGTVVELIDKHLVKIRTEDDWDIPALRNELLVVEAAPESTAKIVSPPVSSSAKKEEKSKQDKDQKTESPEQKEIKDFDVSETETIQVTPRLFLFSLKPENVSDPLNTPLEAYLINDSDYSVLYSYTVVYDGLHHLRETGMLEPDTKYLVESYSRDQLANLSGILIQLIYFRNGPYVPQSPVEKRIKLDTRKFYKEGSFKENDFFDNPALVFTVFDSMNEAVEQLSKADIEAAMQKKNVSQKPKETIKIDASDKEMVIDLHIHELVDDHAGMSNAEMLELQIQHFRKAMDEAIKTHKKRVIFVHGVGQGTLKQDIRAELSRDFKGFDYQDASFKEYGYGATLVHVRQNFRPKRKRR